MGTARFVYNQTVAYLKQPGTTVNWKGIKTEILRSLPAWAASVPYQIKSIAVKDACQAVMNAKRKCKVTGQFQEVKFRSKKAQRDTLFIPKSAVRSQSVYVTMLGASLAPREVFPEIRYDCRLVYQSGEYYLCVPFDRPIWLPENQRQTVVAVDPGIRTPFTWYSPELAGKFGEHDFGRITRLCYHLDALMSRISQAKCPSRYRMRKAASRIRLRIQYLVNELHTKVAVWLCKHFETIYLPTFETSQMVTKLRSKTARAMLTWAHYRFKMTLKHLAVVYQSRVVDVNEAYTSKTCSVCGHVQEIGSREYWTCKQCGTSHQGDENASRGIFLKSWDSLGDTPSRLGTSECIT
jgi:putative transposase